MFSNIYKALNDYREVTDRERAKLEESKRYIRLNYKGEKLKTAQNEAENSYLSYVLQARKTAEETINSELEAVAEKIKAITSESPVTGTAEGIELAKLNLSASERQMILSKYSNNYLSSRLISSAMGDKVKCLSYDEVESALNEAKRTLKHCTSVNNPSGDYDFMSTVKGAELAPVESIAARFINRDFIEVSE